MKIYSSLHLRMKMVWRTQIFGLLKNEDYQLPHLLKMNIAYLKLLETEDLKPPFINLKKMETTPCEGASYTQKQSIWSAIYIYVRITQAILL